MYVHSASIYLLDICCILVCLAAAIIDLRSRKIPNRITLPAIAAGLLLNWGAATLEGGAMHGLVHGLTPSFAGALILFLSFLLFAAGKGVGMGDVKLMAAVGAFLRWQQAIWALAFVLLAGSLLAFLYAWRNGCLRAVFGNMMRAVKKLVPSNADTPSISLHHMPYGLAILIGVFAAVVHRNWPLW